MFLYVDPEHIFTFYEVVAHLTSYGDSEHLSRSFYCLIFMLYVFGGLLMA